MIRSEANIFSPGSVIPANPLAVDLSERPLVEEYLMTFGWQRGVGLLLLGSAGCGKTTLGLSVLKQIHRQTPMEMIYWNEYDFLADLRNLWRLEEMTQKFARDDSLWSEYTEWERSYWDLKEAPFLFLDHLCRAYTPMQMYEVENLLRLRESKGLPTLVACQTGLWENAPFGLTSVVERNSLIVRLESV